MAIAKSAFNTALIAFLRSAPTPFHAVAAMRARLGAANFVELDEAAAWTLAPHGRYFVTRNDSSLIAFRLGAGPPALDGFRMVGAHTDSPCLKLKPNAVIESGGYVKLGVEVYGGVLLHPWFDRDLSLAGRVTVRLRSGKLDNVLIDCVRPLAVIPSLAIHLNRDANEGHAINKQTMLPPLVALSGAQDFNLHAVIAAELQRQGSRYARAEVLDFELALYDTQPAASIGLNHEFIAGARLDNLLSCHLGLQALLDSRAATAQLLACSDHEEVGSGSAAGARGNFLHSVLERVAAGAEAYARMIARSIMVSTDNAHGIHPNFADKHDHRHGPVLNRGPVIKVNSNQSYASNSETAALFRHAAARAKVALQSFVTRSDLGCGSTIGPLTAAALGVRTVDVGVPTFAMHSIRELAGSNDAHALYRVLDAVFALDDVQVGSSRKV